MARQDVNFGFTSTGADGLAKDFRKVGDNATLAAKGARLCADELRAEERASKAAADALHKAERAANLLDIAEHELDREIEKTNRKLLEQAAAADVGARRMAALDRAADRAGKSFENLGKKGPGWLAPLLAAVPALATIGGVGAGAGLGLAGAFTAGAGALAAFSAVAKPVLTDAGKAAGAVEKAQVAHAVAVAKVTGQYQYAMSVAKTKAQRDAAYAAEQKGFSAAGLTQTAAQAKAYAGMSDAQIKLSKQLGGMGDAWDKVKKAQTPVIAGALQPWLKSVTDLTGMLGPIIAKVAPVIGSLGSQFEALVSSKAFTGFRDFIASTGSQAILAGGNLLISFFQALITILPKFNPLIKEATGWIGGLGPKLITWASSQKTADHITAFMAWFNTNGPAVGRLLVTVGQALANLAPGLAAGGALEIKALTGLLGFIAGLPKGIAGPVSAVAGALLILSKLPGGGKVISIGFKAAPAVLKWLTGGVINIGGAAGMQTAADTMVGAAAGMQRAADTMAGAGVLGGRGAAAGAAGEAGLLRTGATGLFAALGPVALGAVAGAALALFLQKYHAQDQKIRPPGQQGPRAPQPASAATAFKTSPLFAGSFMGQDWAKAAAAVTAATNVIAGDFGRQQKAAAAARGDVDTYTASIQANGTGSLATRFARAQLITDLEAAGVKSSVAQGDVDTYTAAVQKNGAQSDQARAARQRLIGDILSASGNARQGNTDLSTYTTAVKNHSLTSDQVRGARARLITDLENAGLDAKTATGMVDGLGTSIHNLPAGKTITIKMVGTGAYTVRQTALSGKPGTFAPGSGGVNPISKGAAAGLYVAAGTSPTADDVMIRASRGELIVPANMVRAGAVDHLRGQIPGFASGGVVQGRLTPGFVTGMAADFEDQFGKAMVGAMRASIRAAEAAGKAAMFDPFAGITGVPSGGKISGSAAAAQAFAKSILWAYGWGQNQFPPLQALWTGESGWRWNALNSSSGAYGIPQSLPASKMASAGADWRTNPATQIRWGLSYIKNTPGYGSPSIVYGKWLSRSPHWYSEGGLVPGYAAGGTVAQQGQTFLNAWRSRHGGPYALAAGPRTLNQQIPPLAAAYGRAQALASAGGLSAGQHRFWAAAAASDARLLATRRKELSVEQAWRGQLTAADATLARQIAAAGNLPGFAGPARQWKAQIAGHKHTIGEISAMIGLTAAQQAAAAAAAAKAIAARPPRQSPFAAWSLLPGPSTATTARAFSFDSGGTLAPGWNPPLYNGTGRPETLVPAGGGGGGLTVNLNISGPVGSQRELETWLGAAVDKLARQGRFQFALKRSFSAT